MTQYLDTDLMLADEAEGLARMFADKYPTPNTRRAVALAEAGQVPWVRVAGIMADAYGKARAEVDA